MKKLFFIFIILIKIFTCRADNVQFTATAPNVVTVGEQFSLEYTINAKPKEFFKPELKDFTILAGPSQSSSSSVQIINGQMTQSSEYTFTYFLQATKEGKFTIEAAKATVGKQTFSSNSISIEVIKGSSKPAQQQQGQQQQPQGQNKTDEVSNDDIFIRINLDKKEVYQGEQIIATIKIYTKLNLSNIDNAKLPPFSGFLKEDIATPPISSLQRENINGTIYGTGVLQRYILIPQQNGEITIDPFELDCYYQRKVASRSHGFFDDFFDNYENVKVPVKSKPVKIKVKPLPANQPASYTGGVGNFSFSASINKNSVKQNDAVTLKIKLTGNGTIKLAEAPKPQLPSDFDLYDPKISNDVKTSTAGVTGTKTYEYLMVPRHVGSYRIPPIEFTYFDPSSGQYKTLKSGEFLITVEKGDSTGGNVVVSGFSKEDVKYIGKDIRFIKTNANKLRARSSFIFGKRGFYFVYIISLVVFIFIVVIWRNRIKQNANIARVKNRKANRMARRRLNAAKAAIKADKKEAFYEEITRALWGYLSDKLTIPVADLSKDSANAELLKHGINEELIDQFIMVIDESEFARYAPGDQSISMKAIYENAITVISNLENKL